MLIVFIRRASVEVWRKETCSVVNSPVGTGDFLSGFFNGKMGVGSSVSSFFGIFRYFLRVICLCFSHCRMGQMCFENGLIFGR